MFFEAGYINLAYVYQVQKRPKQVENVLFKGIKNLPKSSVIKYAYGLHFVRQKNLAKAVFWFEKAMLLSIEYAYTFVLAMLYINAKFSAALTLRRRL